MTPHQVASPDAAKIAMAADILRTRRPIRLRATGTSMLPALWPGDLLTIEPLDATKATVGDIVLAARDGRFVVHRLAQIGGQHGAADWITRGDAMPEYDSPVSAENILGRVSQVERNHREFIVPRQLPAAGRAFAALIAHSDFLRNAVLRMIALRQKLSAPPAATPRPPHSSAAPLFEK